MNKTPWKISLDKRGSFRYASSGYFSFRDGHSSLPTSLIHLSITIPKSSYIHSCSNSKSALSDDPILLCNLSRVRPQHVPALGVHVARVKGRWFAIGPKITSNHQRTDCSNSSRRSRWDSKADSSGHGRGQRTSYSPRVRCDWSLIVLPLPSKFRRTDIDQQTNLPYLQQHPTADPASHHHPTTCTPLSASQEYCIPRNHLPKSQPPTLSIHTKSMPWDHCSS